MAEWVDREEGLAIPYFCKVKNQFAENYDKITSEEIIPGKGWLLHNVLTPEECQAYIDASEAIGFQDSAEYCYQYRSRRNDRLMSDDEEMADFLFQRTVEHIPGTLVISGGTWKASGFNQRMRTCKYTQGHYFGKHIDGRFPQTRSHQSWLTFMIYLNDDSAFEGGNTIFYDSAGSKATHSIAPKAGLALVFIQGSEGNMLHCGEGITSGTKYILRTDIMFRLQ